MTSKMVKMRVSPFLDFSDGQLLSPTFSGFKIQSKTYFNTSEPILFHFITECYEYRNWLGLVPFFTLPGTELKNSVERRSQTGIHGLMVSPRWSKYPWFKRQVRELNYNKSMVFELSMKPSRTTCNNESIVPVVALGADWLFENPGEGYWTIILGWGFGIKYRKERIVIKVKWRS